MTLVLSIAALVIAIGIVRMTAFANMMSDAPGKKISAWRPAAFFLMVAAALFAAWWFAW
jgi:hypothetical protein